MNKLHHFRYLTEHYGLPLAISKSLANVSTTVGRKTGHYISSTYQSATSSIIKGLGDQYSKFIKEWQPSAQNHPLASPSRHIWLCWLQGESEMPPLVHRIYNQQLACYEEYDIHLITEQSIHEYIDIPDFIISKVKDGIISKVQLTDIYRVSLLEQYGGLWMDAMVLPIAPPLREVTQSSFYTIKGMNTHFPGSVQFPEIQTWEGYYIAGQRPHELFYCWMRDFLLNYWKHETAQIHYLLINTIAMLGINAIPTIHQQYENLPETNQSCELLGPALESGSFKTIGEFTADGTNVFKLSRYAKYPQDTLEALFREISK